MGAAEGQWAVDVTSRRHARLPARGQERPDRSEQRLIQAAREGATDALERLYRRSWPHSYRAAYLIVRDEAAAEDIAQEAFLRAVRSLDRFDRRRPFAPWLHRIVVNRAIDWARARALRREVGDAPLSAVSGPPQEDLADLAAALAMLPAEQRAVVVLRYLLGYTPGEIAGLLDLPRGTVNSRMRRALDALGGEFR